MAHFDELKLYFGEPYVVHSPTTDIVIHQPTIGEIVQFGEDKVYGVVYLFVGNPTTYRLQLWDAGIDWNKISNYEMFSMLIQSADKERTSLLFGDLDFSKLKAYTKTVDGVESITLYDPEQNFEVDEDTYNKISEYLKYMFNIYPKVEKAKGKTTKQWIIDEERMKLEQRSKEEKDTSSSLLPLISSCINHAGFKYKKNELREVGIVEFMDSVRRLQVYESTTALMRGAYGGFMDTSKIDKEQFNFMRKIERS